MNNIPELQHAEVMIGSLNKMIKALQFGSNVKLSDLKIISLIYDLLNNSCLKISHEEVLKLNTIYFALIRKNNYICKPDLSGRLQLSHDKFKYNSTHVVEPLVPIKKDFFIYNQKNDFVLNIITNPKNIIDTGLSLLDLPFNTGVNLNISSAGRLIFISDLDILRFKIYDVLNNDITHAFDSIHQGDYYFHISKDIVVGDIINLKLK